MKYSDKQQKIIDFLKEKGVSKKSEIVEHFSHWHYRNSSKYIGEILTRMIKQGIIFRHSKGYYELGSNANPNQLKLF